MVESNRGLPALGALMRAATPDGVALQEHLEGRARLLSAVDEMRASERRRKVAGWSFGATFAAAAAILAVVFGWKAYVNRPLSYAVEGATPGAGGYVSLAPGAAPARVKFDDGSEVVLSGGARGRVAQTTAEGADVVLEAGRAEVRVVHREKTRWSVDAGPYSVHVTGTEFTVAWSPSGESLDVWMKEGRVVVTGPRSREGMALVTGQHLRAQEGALVIDGDAVPPLDAQPDDEEPAPAPTTSAAPSTVPPSGDLPAASPQVAPPTWQKLVGGGRYQDVLAAANDEGVEHALSARGVSDLRALGDAARYTGNAQLALRAYTTIRSRFPSSGEARTAAFLLGRISEEQMHSPSAALRWYDTYLAEAPSGAFAGDALGRKMILTSHSSGAAAAKPLAQEYLRRFPQGTYASAAKNLASP